jgi:hypothetical protein
MKITVKNFRGIESCNIEAAPIALIAGKNFSGKSSICLAVAAALTGHGMPYLKVSAGKMVGMFTKAQAGVMVRAGMDKGVVSVEESDNGLESGRVAISWPDLDVASEGTPPHASVYATGLVNVLDLDERTRNAFFADLLGTKPNREDLIEAFPDPSALSAEQIDKIWKAIESDGWDVSYKTAKEHGAKLKGQWELTTNDRYGATKAAGWIPQGWTEQLASESVEALETSVVAAKQELEKMIAQTAVDVSEIERLRGIANTVQDTTDYQSQLALARAAHSKATEDRNNLPPLEGPLTTIPCPHCEKPLIIVGQTIQAPPTRLRKEENSKRKKDFDVAVDKISGARMNVEGLERKIASKNQAAGIIKAAVERLTELEAKQKQAPAESAVNEVREKVRLSEEALRLFTTKTTAERMHHSIERNQTIIDVLAPDGLRKVKLVKSIEAFNTSLKELCDPAGFKAVSVDEAMDIRYGGRHYALLSASEQYRVRAVLQVAIAQRDGSCMVIFDGADILDTNGREGLFALLRVVIGPQIKAALVAMTIPSASRVPNLREAGLGNSYWIKDGVSQPIMGTESEAA